MAWPATGQIVERAGTTGAIRRSLRFRAGGRRHTGPLGVVSRADAERELACVMADVARGLWKPPTVVEAARRGRGPDVPRVRRGMVDAQSGAARREHAGGLPVAAGAPPAPVLRRAATRRGSRSTRSSGTSPRKLAEDRPLSARSINMTVTLLGAILERAVERELIARNPAKGKDRRSANASPGGRTCDAAGQIMALLDAAGELDAQARRTAGTSSVERSSPRWCSRGCGSASCALCAGVMSTSPAAGCTSGPKTDAGRRRGEDPRCAA